MYYVEEYFKRELEKLEGSLAYLSDAVSKRLSTEQNMNDVREMAEFENMLKDRELDAKSVSDLESSIEAFDRDIEALEADLESAADDERYPIERSISYLKKQRDITTGDLRDLKIENERKESAFSKEYPKLKARYDKIKARYETNNELLGTSDEEVDIENKLGEVKGFADNQAFIDLLEKYSANFNNEVDIIDQFLESEEDAAKKRKLEKRKNEILTTRADIDTLIEKLNLVKNLDGNKIDYETYVALADTYLACDNLITSHDKEVLDVNVKYDQEKDVYVVKASYDNLSNTKEFTPDEFNNDKVVDKYLNKFVEKVALARGKNKDILLNSYCTVTLGDGVLTELGRVSEIKEELKTYSIEKEVEEVEEVDTLGPVLDEDNDLIKDDTLKATEEVEDLGPSILDDVATDAVEETEVLEPSEEILDDTPTMTDEDIDALEDKLTDEAASIIEEDETLEEYDQIYLGKLNELFTKYTGGDEEKNAFIINHEIVQETVEEFMNNKEALPLAWDEDHKFTDEAREAIIALYEKYLADNEEIIKQIISSQEYIDNFGTTELTEESIVPEEAEEKEEVLEPEEKAEPQVEVKQDEVVKQVLTRVKAKRAGTEMLFSGACLVGGAVLMGASAATLPVGGVVMTGGLGLAASANFRSIRYLATNHTMNKIARAFSTKERPIYYKVGAPTKGECGFFDANTHEHLTSRELGELKCEKFGIGYLSYRGKTIQEILDSKFQNEKRLNNPSVLTDKDFDHLGCCTNYEALRKVTIDDLAASFQSFGGVVGNKVQDYLGINNSKIDIEEVAPISENIVTDEILPTNDLEEVIENAILPEENVAENAEENTLEEENENVEENAIDAVEPQEETFDEIKEEEAASLTDAFPTYEEADEISVVPDATLEENVDAFDLSADAILEADKIVEEVNNEIEIETPTVEDITDEVQEENEVEPAVDSIEPVIEEVEIAEPTVEEIDEKIVEEAPAFKPLIDYNEPVMEETAEETTDIENIANEMNEMTNELDKQTEEVLSTPSFEPLIDYVEPTLDETPTDEVAPEHSLDEVIAEETKEDAPEIDIIPGLFEQSEISPEVVEAFKEFINATEYTEEAPSMGSK